MIPYIITITTPDNRDFMLSIFEQHEKLMFYTARKLISDPEDVKDIVQDSVLLLLKKIDQLRSFDDLHLAGYVRLTVRNTSINFLKRRNLSEEKVESLQTIDQGKDDVLSLDDLLILAERKDRLYSVLEELEIEDRLLLEGKYLLDYTDEELAEQLGCKASSIRMKLTRARRKAFQLLKEKEVSGSAAI